MNLQVFLTLLIIFMTLLLVSCVFWWILKTNRIKIIRQVKLEEKSKKRKLIQNSSSSKWVNFNFEDNKYLVHIKWWKRWLEYFMLGTIIFSIAGTILSILMFFKII